MGVSTDGILCYGFQLDEEFEAPWGDDFDDWVAVNLGGLTPPPGDLSVATEPHFRTFWEARGNYLKNCSVELIMHCSFEYPMYILAIRGTGVNASRGYPKQIDFVSLTRIAEEKTEAYKDLLHKLGIKTKPLEWLLCSLWG